MRIKYRPMKLGETIRHTDEWEKRLTRVDKVWYVVPSVLVGVKVSAAKAKFYRRPVPVLPRLYGVYKLTRNDV